VAAQAHREVYGIAWHDLLPYEGTVLAVAEDDDPGTGAMAGVYSLRWNGSALVPTSVALLPGMVAEQMVLTRAGIGGVPAVH
jgi:hypothetical protein